MTTIPLSALDRPVAYHRVFRTISGSTVAAVFLSQAWYWTQRLPEDRDGWFYKTQAEWEAEVGLSRREQETARKALVSLGILEEERKGNPAKLWFRIDTEQLATSITEACTNKNGRSVQTRMAESANQECTNPPISHTETTTEITAPREKNDFSPPPTVPEIPTPPTPINRVGDDSPRDQLIREHCRLIGVPRPVDIRVARQNADKLVAAGITSADLPAMIAWFRAQPWIHDVDLSTLVRFADRWTSSGDRPITRDETQEELIANHPRFPEWTYLGLYEDSTAGCNQWMNDIRNGTLPQFRKVSK